ncbi:MAG: carbon-nitrogen hydrolase family protein [Epsilonproteobacteria bacterium]|nr:carbon-nitrogen hydrolase family protein [Campylobacterota bacterium]
MKLVVIGEYVLNLFFKELEKMPISFIKQQSLHQLNLFKKLASSYQMTIIAPIVLVKQNKIYKAFVRFSPKSTRFYYQQVFMPYSHWNEKKFFATISTKPLIFKVEDISVGLMAGFEAHFDEFWQYFQKKNVDLVVVPSVATFNSKQRWRHLLTTFAFLNNCYVLRANRVGAYQDWRFYGDSFIADPDGEIVDYLGDKEELLIADVYKKVVKEASRGWKFRSLSKDAKLDKLLV